MSSTISSDQKKSLAISILLYATMLLILFFIRFWPPTNMDELAGGGSGGGVTVNFGNSDFGSGANYKSEILDVKNQTRLTSAKSTTEEAILSQENSTEESVVIPTKEKTKKKPTVAVKEETKLVVVQPKVSDNTNDALSSILKGSNKGGDGDDKAAGNKGKTNGSLSSNGNYGAGGNGTGTGIGTGTGYGSGSGSGGTGGGSGGGVGYSLGNRKALSKPAPKYTCNEQGKVVVEVSVDRTGRTVNAVAGVKGTTNTAKCLLDQARIAAMNTKWDASSDAPEKQVGKIVYNFNLN